MDDTDWTDFYTLQTHHCVKKLAYFIIPSGPITTNLFEGVISKEEITSSLMGNTSFGFLLNSLQKIVGPSTSSTKSGAGGTNKGMNFIPFQTDHNSGPKSESPLHNEDAESLVSG